jgi:hypothetical protein
MVIRTAVPWLSWTCTSVGRVVPQLEVSDLLSGIALSVILAIDVVSLWSSSWIYRKINHAKCHARKVIYLWPVLNCTPGWLRDYVFLLANYAICVWFIIYVGGVWLSLMAMNLLYKALTFAIGWLEGLINLHNANKMGSTSRCFQSSHCQFYVSCRCYSAN